MMHRCPSELELWPAVVGEAPRSGVARHLRNCPDCRARVAAARRNVSQLRSASRSEPQDDGPPAVVTSPELPAHLGGYQVLGVLGEGGQAIVYRAWHHRLNRELAIKRLRSGNTSGNLKHEALLMSSIDHPLLPKVFDLVEEGHDVLLVLELVHGTPLSDWQQPLSGDILLRMVIDLVSQVSELHRSELLHLDLSPANVLVDEAGRCRLIDFGLARAARCESTQPNDSRLIGGTPGFAAPEIWNSPEAVDHRADLYSLGALIDFMIERTGQGGPHTRASKRRLADLAAVARRALHEEPSLRWNSADDMLESIHRAGDAGALRRTVGLLLATSACLLFGTEGPQRRTAVASVQISESPADSPRPPRRGDRIAFSFAVPGPGAGLAVRSPSGHLHRLRPFERDPHSRTFRFPADGGVMLRQEQGAYVVFFWTEPDVGHPFDPIRVLRNLPAPPVLASGQQMISTPADDPGGQNATTPIEAVWRASIRQSRRQLSDLTAIAFQVD